jgi:hypothetical protein
MGTRADFYLMNDDGRMMWVGSKAHDGSPVNIPTDILIQINPVMFEELVLDFLNLHRGDSIIRQDGDTWPWPWADSRVSDYSYLFVHNKVLAYSPSAGHWFDPLKIVQGEDLGAAYVLDQYKFPIMNPAALEMQEETMELVYGSKSTETL